MSTPDNLRGSNQNPYRLIMETNFAPEERLARIAQLLEKFFHDSYRSTRNPISIWPGERPEIGMAVDLIPEKRYWREELEPPAFCLASYIKAGDKAYTASLVPVFDQTTLILLINILIRQTNFREITNQLSRPADLRQRRNLRVLFGLAVEQGRVEEVLGQNLNMAFEKCRKQAGWQRFSFREQMSVRSEGFYDIDTLPIDFSGIVSRMFSESFQTQVSRIAYNRQQPHMGTIILTNGLAINYFDGVNH